MHWRNHQLSQDSSSVIALHWTPTLTALAAVFLQTTAFAPYDCIMPACYLEVWVCGRREGLCWNNREWPQSVRGLHNAVKWQLLAWNEKRLLSTMSMTGITMTIQHYQEIGICQQQFPSSLRTNKIALSPKKGNFSNCVNLPWGTHCSASLSHKAGFIIRRAQVQKLRSR